MGYRLMFLGFCVFLRVANLWKLCIADELGADNQGRQYGSVSREPPVHPSTMVVGGAWPQVHLKHCQRPVLTVLTT
jgi:hypothetical protein